MTLSNNNNNLNISITSNLGTVRLLRSNAMDNLVAFEMLTEESMENLQILFPEDEDLRIRIQEELERREARYEGNDNAILNNIQIMGIPFGNLN